jgi:protein gp37
MAGKTKIEWATDTWNPVVGCTIVSPGCTNCYAMRFAGARLDGSPKAPHYAGTTMRSKAGAVWTGKVALAPEHILTAPLRWRRPRMIFVNSMGDLFHEAVPDEWIDQVFAVMALSPQHTFQVLTKRAERMRAYLVQFRQEGRHVVSDRVTSRDRRDGNRFLLLERDQCWPLPNVWLGVSAEDQRRAEERIPHLLATPAAVRFVSAEPLLAQVNLHWMHVPGTNGLDALHGETEELETGRIVRGPRLDWIIVGGESGPSARPMHPDWARSIRDQCAAAGTAFLFKQWGEWVSAGEIGFHGHEHRPRFDMPPASMMRVGKHRAGRLLDGQEHNGFPAAAGDLFGGAG